MIKMDNRQIMVSITMISYNHEPYLRKCLDSILAQKVNFRYQVIIGEDCSPDNSRVILKEYEQKYPDIFLMIYNEKNLGSTQNSINVKQYIEGKYVICGETDDFWTDEYRLQKQFDFLEKHPDYVAVGSNFYSVDASGQNFSVQLFKWQVDKTYCLKDYLRYGYTLHGNTFMHRNILPYKDEKYKELRRNTPTMGDVITRVLLYDKGNIFVLPDVMHAHRGGEANVTSFSYTNRARSIEYSYMYCKMVDALEKYLNFKYDLSLLKANRSAGLMMLKRIHHYDIDKGEYKKYLQSLGKKTLRKTERRFWQKLFRSVLHKLARIFNKKYRTHKIDG